ncbi:hypothetical protein [Persicitalea sp.]|uniref:hypothetical protein n=1 Tax=Persicitalea sp. TaxID=3100273 RepID=UPI00359461FE
MTQTFQLNTAELNANFIKSVRALFGEKKIKIVVEDVEESQPVDEKELFRKTEEIRLSLKDFKVDPDVNFSELADEMYL